MAKRKSINVLLSVLFTITTLFWTSCNDEFVSATPPIVDVNLIEAKVSSSYAYFLSEDGDLFCSGADTDASSYVQYQDKKNCIVARGVMSFGTMANGGYYITKDHELYMFNKNEQKFLGYTEKKTHKKVLSEVLEAYFGNHYLVWLTSCNSMNLAGLFQGTQYSVENPLVLGNNVVAFACKDENILWIDDNGSVHSEGEVSQQTLESLQQVIIEKSVKKLKWIRGILYFSAMVNFGIGAIRIFGAMEFPTEIKS